jgi:hypothetical protein
VINLSEEAFDDAIIYDLKQIVFIRFSHPLKQGQEEYLQAAYIPESASAEPIKFNISNLPIAFNNRTLMMELLQNNEASTNDKPDKVFYSMLQPGFGAFHKQAM